MGLSKEEFSGIFVIALIILATSLIFEINPAYHLPISFLLQNPLVVLLYAFLEIGIIFLICTCIYSLIKKYKTKKINPNIITVKRKFYLNQTELLILIGTIGTISIPFLILWQDSGDINGFLNEGSKLLSDMMENPFAIILFILMIGALIGVVAVSAFIFIKNLCDANKTNSIKSMSFDTYKKQVNICCGATLKTVNFDDIDTLLLNIQTVKIPKIKPGVLRASTRNDALGSIAKSINAADLAQNCGAALYEVEIVLKTIKNKEYKINISTNALFDPFLYSVFSRLSGCKRYFNNFEYNFIGPVILNIEKILKR